MKYPVVDVFAVFVSLFILIVIVCPFTGFPSDNSFALIFILMYFVPVDFIPLACDSGGVTTGTISIPFIITLGIGLVSNRVDSKAKEESFGLVSLASTGPIIMVLLLGKMGVLDFLHCLIILLLRFQTCQKDINKLMVS